MKALISIFWDSIRPLKLVTVPLYLLCAIGFAMPSKRNSLDMVFAFGIAPWWVWTLACSYVLVARVVGLFFWRRGRLTALRLTPAVGIVIWSMLFSASVAAPDLGMGLLYLVAATIEVWILARVFAYGHYKK